MNMRSKGFANPRRCVAALAGIVIAALAVACSTQGGAGTAKQLALLSAQGSPTRTLLPVIATRKGAAGRNGATPMPRLLVDDAPMSPETCLACHGSLEDIAAKSKDYVDEFGDKVNPHVYIPHNSQDLPNCLQCHKEHPIPPPAKVEMGEITMDYCFTCHHQQNFEKCSDCHSDK